MRHTEPGGMNTYSGNNAPHRMSATDLMVGFAALSAAPGKIQITIFVFRWISLRQSKATRYETRFRVAPLK
jgi:hypothetical protein